MSDQDALWDLFKVEEYPDNVAENALPQGAFYEYISSTFLNGIINYVNIFATYMIRDKEDFGVVGIDAGVPKEVIVEKPLEQGLSVILPTEPDKRSHTCLGDFGELVTVLAETENSFWVFCYDPDVSDCGIGRCAKTEMSRDDFESLFLSSVHYNEHAIKVPWKPKGWVSF